MTGALLEQRVDQMRDDIKELKTAITSIAQSLQVLSALEVKHMETREALSRAFTEITGHDQRLHVIENDMPVLRLTSSAARAIGWLVITAVVGAVLVLVLTKGGNPT